MAEIEHELRIYILKNYFFHQENAFSDADSFMELGVIDSTGVLELVSHLEETYSIRIDTDELIPENLDSIDNLARFLRCKLAVKGEATRATPEIASASSTVPARGGA